MEEKTMSDTNARDTLFEEYLEQKARMKEYYGKAMELDMKYMEAFSECTAQEEEDRINQDYQKKCTEMWNEKEEISSKLTDVEAKIKERSPHFLTRTELSGVAAK